MASSLALPLVMASVFTLSCILIQRAGTRANAVTDGLGFLFLFCVLLNAIALLAFFGRPRGIDPAFSLAASARSPERQNLPRGRSCRPHPSTSA